MAVTALAMHNCAVEREHLGRLRAAEEDYARAAALARDAWARAPGCRASTARQWNPGGTQVAPWWNSYLSGACPGAGPQVPGSGTPVEHILVSARLGTGALSARSRALLLPMALSAAAAGSRQPPLRLQSAHKLCEALPLVPFLAAAEAASCRRRGRLGRGSTAK